MYFLDPVIKYNKNDREYDPWRFSICMFDYYIFILKIYPTLARAHLGHSDIYIIIDIVLLYKFTSWMAGEKKRSYIASVVCEMCFASHY
jgi:hypothetical protein